MVPRSIARSMRSRRARPDPWLLPRAYCSWLRRRSRLAEQVRKKVARLTPRHVTTIGTKPSASRILHRGRPMGDFMPTQRRLANAIRALAMDAVEAANSGHPGMPMGMADAATALFTRHLKYRPGRSALARPRPLRAVGRPWLDADLCAAAPDRLRPADDRGNPQFPPAAQPLRRAIRKASSWPGSRRPPARWARAWPPRSAWRSPSAT